MRSVHVRRLRSLVAVWLAGAIGAGGCRVPATTSVAPSGGAPGSPIAKGPAAPGDRPLVAFDAKAIQPSITLRDPDPRTSSVVPAAIAALTPNETNALLAHLEPLPDLTKRNAAAPTMRAPSLTPPRGDVHAIAFAVPTGKAIADAPATRAVERRPLSPPAIAPEGEVRAESEVRIRFDEPMAAVAAVGTVAKPDVTLSPPATGAWSWIDTRTLQFTAKTRLAYATEYTVTVPAGVRAVSGNVLTAPVTAKFSTRPVGLSDAFPRKIRPDSAVVVEFDQDVDVNAILPRLHFEYGDARKRIEVKAVSLADAEATWAKNPAVTFDHGRFDSRHIAVAPVTPWPAGSAIQIILEPGAPSREGPRLSTKQSFANFSVVPPFQLAGLTCFGADKPRLAVRCPADDLVYVGFSTPIAVASYRAQKVQIDGEPFQDNKPANEAVMLSAPTAVGKSYTVVVGDGLVDIFGQPFTGVQRATFTTSQPRFDSWLEATTGMMVLDPRFAIPQWVVRAEAVTALRVRLYQVQPKDFFAYRSFENGERASAPGKLVSDTSHPIGTQYGGLYRVDLRPALAPEGVGHVVAVASITAPGGSVETRKAWLQVTKLADAARIDGERVNAWVTDISPAKLTSPVANAAVSLIVDGRASVTATADAEGHAVLDLPERKPRAEGARTPPALLEARSGADSTFELIDGQYEKAQRVANALWYVTDDRFTYKPGEKVYVKGWIRWTHDGINPDLSLPKTSDNVAYTLTDARGNKIANGTVPITDQGGFDVEVALPGNANLGRANFTFATRGETLDHPISIMEFRTPAYAVSLNDDLQHGGAVPLVLGEAIEMAVTATYYAGGTLAGAGVRWNARLTPTTFAPPGWELYSFTPATPRSQRGYYSYRYRDGDTIRERGTSTLGGSSTATTSIAITSLADHRPSVLEVDSTVTDLDRMSLRASSRAILVHPSAYYVGVRQKPTTDDALEVEVVDIDGKPVAGAHVDVTVEAVLASERYRDDAAVVETQTCSLTSAETPVICTFTRSAKKELAYSATARVADKQGRPNATQLDVTYYATEDRKVDFAIHADRPIYRPGDTARIEIMSKVLPATAVVTFARNGVMTQKRVALAKESTWIELPIEPSYIKDVHVLVDRFAKRDGEKGAPPLPRDDSVQLTIPVDMEGARLSMTARPRKPLVEPGDQATFDVEVKHDGKPMANAEVALLVVDEAVLALSDNKHGDPLPVFYHNVDHGTVAMSTVPLVTDAGEDITGSPGFERYKLDAGRGFGRSGYGVGGGGAGMRGRTAAVPSLVMGIVNSRKDFRANAVFAPRLHTDANGHAQVSVKMPDSLTRFRVVALGTAEMRYFGIAESAIVTQRKLNARAVAPRFATMGDTFALPVVVQNLDTAPRTVDVAVRAANLATTGTAGKRITIPGGQRAEVRFDFATVARGRAVVQTIVTSGDFADASNVELMVYEPATTEAFATYGVVDEAPQVEQLAVPADLYTDVGGVEVELASTQLQSLTDAYWYLYAYPYECAEQRSARMLATAAIYDILEAFGNPNRPTRSEIEETLTRDVVALERTQNSDGGWGYFRDMKSDPFVTMQVVQALAARKVVGGIAKPATVFVNKQATSLLDRLTKAAALPAAKRSDRADHPYMVSLAAAALATLAAIGTDVAPRALQLHALALALDAYPVDAKARLLALVAKQPRASAMRTKLLADLVSATHETASAATVTATYAEAERLLLVSSNKTTALALDALVREAPEHALIPKLARGVLEARKRGRWISTQENLVVLATMRRYFDTYEKATPSFTGKLWFGSSAYAEQAFAGRSSARSVSRLDWTALPAGSTHDLALAKTGTGRMYYRVGIAYAPKQPNLPPLDAGFVVRRTYAAVDDPADVQQTKDGWKIRLGARVLVTLETLNTTVRYDVALVDPLPAGFEPINDALANAERGVTTIGDTRWDYRNMRDNRVEAFAMHLAEGSHHVTYAARATTPGRFIAAPAKAEEMYSPETFGRSAGTVVVIE